MASSRVMPSSTTSRNSDHSHRSSSSVFSSLSTNPISDQSRNNHKNRRRNNEIKSDSSMTVDGILRDGYHTNPPPETTLLDASITLIDAPAHTRAASVADVNGGGGDSMNVSAKSADEVWGEIVSVERKEMKEEVLMTLEDFLAKAGPVQDAAPEEIDMKVEPERMNEGIYGYDPVSPNAFQMLDKVEGSIVGFGNGMEVYGGSGVRGKRGRPMIEPMDKAAAQRQRRMIKNRESAARSRERKQAYQVELESLASKLEVENDQLVKEKAERTKERFNQLMEKIVPVEEKRKPPRTLRRVRSLQW